MQENLRLLELVRLQALAELDRLLREIVELREALGHVRAELGVARSSSEPLKFRELARTASAAEIETVSADLRAEIVTMKGEHRKLVATAGLASLATKLAVSAQAQASTDVRRLKAETDARAERAARILSRAPDAITDAERDRLQATAEAFVAAPASGRANGLEQELRAAVQLLRDGEAARSRAMLKVAALRAELRGLDGAEVRRAASTLDKVESGAMALELQFAEQVRAAAAAARAQSDREYALEVLREEFSALGYVVGESFETAFMSGGNLSVRKGGKDDYAVDIDFDPVEQTIATHLVRNSAQALSEAEQRLRDREAEEGWCEDYARILAAAARRKVRARVTRRTPPGVEAVPLAASAETSRTVRRRAEQTQARDI